MAGPTSKTAQAELVDMGDLIGELAVVLDHVDEVGARQQASKGRSARVPEGCRDDACIFAFGQRCLPLYDLPPRTNQSGANAPFWMRMFRLFLIRRSLSSTTRRKESGSTS